MPTLRSRSEAAKSEDLQKRVTQGTIQAANEILEAGLSDTPSDLESQRYRLAQMIIQSPGMLVASLAQNVASHPNFGSDPGNMTGNDPSTDSETGDGALMYILREKWDDYAASLGAPYQPGLPM